MTQSSTDSSLVERLRAGAVAIDNDATPSQVGPSADDLRNAAFAISTLERELEEARADVKEMTEAANSYAHQAARAAIALTAAEAKVARMGDALNGLVQKLDVVHADSRYESVWTIAQLHSGVPYTGPTYVTELATARSALQPEKDREGEDGR